MLGFPNKGHVFYLFKCEMDTSKFTDWRLWTLTGHPVCGYDGMFLDMGQALHVISASGCNLSFPICSVLSNPQKQILATSDMIFYCMFPAKMA